MVQVRSALQGLQAQMMADAHSNAVPIVDTFKHDMILKYN